MRWAIGSLLLVVMLTTNLATAVPGFTDVPAGHVFESQVNWMAEQGITRGCNPPINDQFCPDDPVTRGQMAAFLVRALDLTEVDPNLDVFEDTIDSFFLSDIMILATSGITKGCNPPANDRFCPDDVVTRGQMGAFLVRSFGLTEVDPDVSFGDADDSVFRTDIVRLATAGITKGCNPPANDWYCPNDVVTRGQMAAFLHRATGLLPRITTEELSGGTVGEPYTSTLVAAGGEPPYSWTVTGLPDGVVHNSGDLVGTPTANGHSPGPVGLEDSRGGEASGSLVIDVDLPLGIVTEVLPVGTTGEPYTFSVVATGGEPPHEWSADGLPDGLSVRADGSFAGAATVPGLSVVELVVADTEGRVDTRPLLLEVSGPLTIVKSELPSGTVGESYSGSLEAAGGEPPYTWTVTSEPPGIEADSTGAMTGTPTLSGEYTLNVAVTDADGRITVAAVLFDVDHPLDIVTDSLDDAALYRTYDMSLIATGGEPAYSWTSPNLPDGLTLDPSGSISGTPDYFGNHWISFTATDADGRTAAVDFDLFVRGMMWASMSASGEPGNDECHSGAISGDGRYVAFSSQAGNLTDGDDNHQIDVFRQDR
ncbi:MAG: S-layer homology domain-containing protein, partial [Actinomycetota bacterium]|nr:S-layer homology domain-containing protein [Actinomycetota bacterium]